MSNKRDYTRYSKEDNKSTDFIKPAEVTEETVETVDSIVEEPIVETVEEPITESKAIYGIVTDCIKLNVREQPKPNAHILGTIDEGSEVIVNEDESTGDFYKICTSAGLEGYCMRKFVSIMP